MNKSSFKYKGNPEFKGYYTTFMECLKDVANEETQLKEWKMGECDQTIVFSFSEISQEFMGFAETIFKIYKDVGFSVDQLHLIKNLYEMVEKYDASLSRPDTDAEIIEDPKWHEIREYAKVVYQELTKEE